MNKEIKRHLVSFAITFMATFLLILGPAIYSGEFEAGILLSAIVAAARSAFKVAWELAILPLLIKLLDWAKVLIKKVK